MSFNGNEGSPESEDKMNIIGTYLQVMIWAIEIFFGYQFITGQGLMVLVALLVVALNTVVLLETYIDFEDEEES